MEDVKHTSERANERIKDKINGWLRRVYAKFRAMEGVLFILFSNLFGSPLLDFPFPLSQIHYYRYLPFMRFLSSTSTLLSSHYLQSNQTIDFY